MELGRLEQVAVRSVWGNEARDFTPWLLANADRLGEALGLELELTEAEHAVGGYALDLIGRNLSNDSVVIVENQLEGTDHTHLGQILTYASGTGASTIVWVATAFREEHRQVLDWLNEQTAEDLQFFGVQVSVVRIGNSAAAPLFDVVAKPNDWQKQLRTATRAQPIGTKGELYRQFWSKYLTRQVAEHPDWGRRRTPQPGNWMGFPGPISGTQLNPSFAAGGRLRHELYIDTGDGEENMHIFEHLLSHRDRIEEVYGGLLEFDPIEDRRACRVAAYGEGSVTDSAQWDVQVDWFLDTGRRLRAALLAVPRPARPGAAGPASTT